MSAEPLSTTVTDNNVASAEKGLLIAVLMLVLLGVAGMLFMI
jgi:hypothetical protein